MKSLTYSGFDTRLFWLVSISLIPRAFGVVQGVFHQAASRQFLKSFQRNVEANIDARIDLEYEIDFFVGKPLIELCDSGVGRRPLIAECVSRWGMQI